MKLVYDINDKPTVKQNLMFALQEMIAIMAATLLVPILMTQYGLPSDPAAALLGAGIGTLVYIFCTKKKSPVFLGSSFAFLGAYATSISSGYGYWGIIIGVGIAALVYVIFAVIIKAVGSGWVNKLHPAVQELAQRFFKGYITTAVGESETVRRKPCPDAVLAAMKELQSSQTEAIYVGDSEVDLQTAQNAQMPCALVTWGFRDEEYLHTLPHANQAQFLHAPTDLLTIL